MFVDRRDELAILQHVITRQRGGELVLLYGRHRVGKTALLRHWATQSAAHAGSAARVPSVNKGVACKQRG